MQTQQSFVARQWRPVALMICTFLLGSVALSTAMAETPNLLENGDFATDLSGWEAPFGGVTWSAMDESNDPDSGSLLLTDVGEFGAQFTQCLAVDFLGPQEFSLSYFVPSEVTTVFTNGIILFVVWYDNPACSIALTSTQIDSGATIQGQWVRIGESLPVPPGADSVQVWPLMVGSGSSDFTSFIDSVYVGDRVFSDSFE